MEHPGEVQGTFGAAAILPLLLCVATSLLDHCHNYMPQTYADEKAQATRLRARQAQAYRRCYCTHSEATQHTAPDANTTFARRTPCGLGKQARSSTKLTGADSSDPSVCQAIPAATDPLGCPANCLPAAPLHGCLAAATHSPWPSLTTG